MNISFRVNTNYLASSTTGTIAHCNALLNIKHLLLLHQYMTGMHHCFSLSHLPSPPPLPTFVSLLRCFSQKYSAMSSKSTNKSAVMLRLMQHDKNRNMILPNKPFGTIANVESNRQQLLFGNASTVRVAVARRWLLTSTMLMAKVRG